MKETKTKLIFKVSERESGDTLISAESFSISVEKRVIEGGLTFREALLDVYESVQDDISPEDVGKLVNKALKEKLAYELGIGYKTTGSKLPI